jgi:hypothetical protein
VHAKIENSKIARHRLSIFLCHPRVFVLFKEHAPYLATVFRISMIHRTISILPNHASYSQTVVSGSSLVISGSAESPETIKPEAWRCVIILNRGCSNCHGAMQVWGKVT